MMNRRKRLTAGHIGQISLRAKVAGVVLALACVSGSAHPTLRAAATSQPGLRSIVEVARNAVEAPQVGSGVLSPDSSQIIYTVARSSVAENHVSTELLIQRVGSDGTPSEMPFAIDRVVQRRDGYQFAARWCPDGTCVTYIAPLQSTGGPQARGTLMRYDVRSGRRAPVPIHDRETQAWAGDRRPQIVTIGRDYQWAPSGDVLAFTAPLETLERARPQIGVRVEGVLLRNLTFPAPVPRRGVFTLEPATGRVEQLTPDFLDVDEFDWSPNSQSLAVGAVKTGTEADDQPSRDLFVVDRPTRTVRDVVRQRGNDNAPVWSPDGRWIAFRSAFGVAAARDALGIVSAQGGRIVRLAGGDPDDLIPVAGGKLYWTRDSRTFYYATYSQMTRRLQRADLTGRIESMPINQTFGIDQVSLSLDTQWLIIVRSSLSVPQELCLQRLRDGLIRQITALSSDFPLSSLVKTERVGWPSRSGDAKINGMLLTPIAENTMEEGETKTRLPTLVFVKGGPSMVEASYDQSHAEILSLAAHGFAVLIPNTRGRVGYGTAYAYRDGFPDPLSYANIPYEDIISGVDFLVERGIADPTRLGIIGHSYGGYLTAYAVTQTHRFRGSVVYEGAGAQMVQVSMEYQPTSAMEGFNRLMGVSNPFTPADIVRLIRISPGFNMHCIATPMLLLYGEQTPAKVRNAHLLFSGLQRFGIPTELILFDEGHVIQLPTAKVDAIERIAVWFDYWIRDIPYPDSSLSATFETWQKANVSTRATPPSCAEKSWSLSSDLAGRIERKN